MPSLREPPKVLLRNAVPPPYDSSAGSQQLLRHSQPTAEVQAIRGQWFESLTVKAHICLTAEEASEVERLVLITNILPSRPPTSNEFIAFGLRQSLLRYYEESLFGARSIGVVFGCLRGLYYEEAGANSIHQDGSGIATAAAATSTSRESFVDGDRYFVVRLCS